MGGVITCDKGNTPLQHLLQLLHNSLNRNRFKEKIMQQILKSYSEPLCAIYGARRCSAA
ncbi:hypothetical protein H4S14_003850 [Agrobacterium vitis]|nr:hypothetical protein [Agrobacterium vitis]MBE1440079.1 hypothetical protein [Agrobacterium vitis]